MKELVYPWNRSWLDDVQRLPLVGLWRKVVYYWLAIRPRSFRGSAPHLMGNPAAKGQGNLKHHLLWALTQAWENVGRDSNGTPIFDEILHLGIFTEEYV